jgi:hypothetical protein
VGKLMLKTTKIKDRGKRQVDIDAYKMDELNRRGSDIGDEAGKIDKGG